MYLLNKVLSLKYVYLILKIIRNIAVMSYKLNYDILLSIVIFVMAETGFSEFKKVINQAIA